MESPVSSKHELKREYWQQQISDCKVSGLSQKRYCQRHSLALSTFYYWKSRINNPESSTPIFYPLAIPTSHRHTRSPDAGLLLLVGKKRFQVEIKKDFSSTTLEKLITTLEQL